MRSLAYLVVAAFACAGPSVQAQESGERPLFELDGLSFVTFYDLPSRRFRAIRQAFITRDFESARRDLEVTKHYLDIEIVRAQPKIAAVLTKLAEQLGGLARDIESQGVTVAQLDPIFARVHWLLSQHFLQNAVASRDAKKFKEASNYLIAAAHHMERTVLWSNARITPRLERGLDQLRVLADRLAKNPRQKWVTENKPVIAGAKLLRELGEHLDRTILVEE